MRTGVQTKNLVRDEDPAAGFRMLRQAGLSCADFSLNGYLPFGLVAKDRVNDFFDRSERELEDFFRPHREAAAAEGVTVNQMHMPYPLHSPSGELDEYLQRTVAVKSLAVCASFGCPNIVVHGLKLARRLGSEAAEWERNEAFLRSIAPRAKELGLTLCMENLYDDVGGKLLRGPCCDAALTAERIDRLNDELGAEVFGFCFDAGHANLTGLDAESFLKTLGSRVKVLHLHDNDGVADLHQVPFTFSGKRGNGPGVDWEGVLKGLRAIGFRGVLSFETSPVLQSFPAELGLDALSLIGKIGAWFAARIAAED